MTYSSPVCPDCSAMNPPGARFCESCGRELANAMPQPDTDLRDFTGQSDVPPPREQQSGGLSVLTCPRCGISRTVTDQFCRSCGLPLETAGVFPDRPVAVNQAGAPAGFWLRLAAWVIDLIPYFILGVIVVGLFFDVTPLVDDDGTSSDGTEFSFTINDYRDNIVAAAILAAYHFLILASIGTTLGRRVLNISIVNRRGQRPTIRELAVRQFAWGAQMGFAFGIPLVIIALRDDKRGIHDLLSDTYAVRR